MNTDDNKPDTDDIQHLLLQEAELKEKLEAVRKKLGSRTRVAPSAGRRSRPARAFALDTLEELGGLAYSRELSLYIKARYGHELAATRFGSLGIDELKAFRSDRARPVYLCHALTDKRFEAIKRLWGRSDWPLWTRIVAPTTGRVQHLQMTARLCELAETVKSADPESLRIIAADHARALPGIHFKRGMFDLAGWRKIALSELDRWRSLDQDLREQAAERLMLLDTEQQLFGVPEKMLVAMPGQPALPVPPKDVGVES